SQQLEADLLERIAVYAQTVLRASAAYWPCRQVHAPVALVRALDAERTVEDGLDMGWLAHVEDQLVSLVSPGRHETMLFGSNARILGEQLEDWWATVGRH